MSASRKFISPNKVITAGDMSLASLTSKVTVLQTDDQVAYQLVWSGTSPVGAAKIQGSLDYLPGNGGVVLNAGNWVDIPVAPALNVSGNTGSLLALLQLVAFPYIRLVYTKTSGIGSLNVNVSSKGL